jgi:putative colanic acid biosysnthesis UDP-glucose lipid carrier transferase
MIGTRYIFLKRYTLLLMDFIILNSGFLFACIYINLTDSVPSLNKQTILYLGIFNALWLINAYFLKLYSADTLKSVESIFRSTWKVTAVHLSLICVLPFFAGTAMFSFKLMSVAVCYAIVITGLVISRFFITYIVEFIIKKGGFKKKIAIVGYNHQAHRLAAYFRKEKSVYSFQGYFSDRHGAGYYAATGTHGIVSGNILAPVKECIDYAVAEGISEIYSTLSPDDDLINEMVEQAEHNCVRIKFVTDAGGTEVTGSYERLNYVDGLRITNSRHEPLEDLKNRIKKRVFDISISLFVTVFILSWLIPLLGILIKLESRGPVFFIQKRSGRNNSVFRCIKFRSMRSSSESDTKQANKEDNRITRIGSFLRRNSIDEFPQFLNVLTGSMSIVGPRPHMLAHTEQYGKIIDSYMVRQLLKPGITGWAQVNGLRGETQTDSLMEKRVAYDLWYMENWSLMLDIKIAFMTIINILRGEDTAF